jgi:hypothetical protein
MRKCVTLAPILPDEKSARIEPEKHRAARFGSAGLQPRSQRRFREAELLKSVKSEILNRLLKNSNLLSLPVRREAFLPLYLTLTTFLKNYLDRMERYIRDYINMTVNLKERPSLKIKTMAGLIKKHNEIALQLTLERTPQILIPQNSVFNALKLPPEYERILTRERLVAEGQTQRHCVASYAGQINRDKCAIFSTVYEDKRYTIQIVYKKKNERKKFAVSQIRGFANAPCPNELWTEIDLLLR